MRRARPIRSISGPIALSAVSVALAAGLIVGWIYVIWRNLELTRKVAQNTWLLVAGVLSLLTIIVVLVLFAVFLAREIREVRRQTSFLDSVTHELRSPLASLRLCLETLARPDLDPGRADGLRQMMLEDVERLEAFVDDILEASQAGFGERMRAITDVPVSGVVGRAVRTAARRHHVDPTIVRIDVPPGLCVRADATALEIVLRNLLDNAIKYSEGRPQVGVSARIEGDRRVRITVEDRGIGIPRADQRRIFERFYRVPEESVRARRGTGLGLFVVQTLVHGMGGKLRVESDGQGRGTRVHVRLPRAKPQPAYAASPHG